MKSYPKTLPQVTPDSYREHMRKNTWNYKYLHRNLSSVLHVSPTDRPLCLAYFDEDGVLLNLYGNETLKKQLSDIGLIPGSYWRLQEIGHNAVTDGLQTLSQTASEGVENEFPPLQDFALYFSPILLKFLSQPVSYDTPPRNFGGIAVIVPTRYVSPNFQFLANSIAHDTVMTLHFNQHAIRLYEQVGSGLLIIDNSMNSGEATITYANQTLFHALDIPEENVFFTPLDEFLPKKNNTDFWRFVKKQEDIPETPITLSLKGKSVFCSMHCIAFDQPFLNASGVICFITTPQMESRKISKKMGNSAILSFPNIVGQSASIRAAIRRANLISATDSNVMILGESGTGKDVFAQAIHNASSRKNKPFIAVNCGALPKELIASELFGYDSGAFTGAKKNGNIGKFELANGGTIFLDEIGDLPLDLQATLLRVVEQKQLMRLGSNRLIDVDVKIISATNADMAHMIQQKLFRSDLFFRLSTLRLNLPPLREREGDPVLLAEYFIDKVCKRIGRTDHVELTPEAADLLLSLSWPGNIRELQNLIECIVQLYPDSKILPQHILENLTLENTETIFHPVGTLGNPLNAFPSMPASTENADTSSSASVPAAAGKRRKRITEEDLLNALEACDGNRTQAATWLGISRKTLYRKLEQFGIPTK